MIICLLISIKIVISLNTWKDETPCELGHDPETKQGCWILDKEDRRYIVKSFLYFKLFYIFILNYGFSLCDLRKLLTEKVHFPKKMMLFAAVGTCLPKPYWEFIEIGSRLNAKKWAFILGGDKPYLLLFGWKMPSCILTVKIFANYEETCAISGSKQRSFAWFRKPDVTRPYWLSLVADAGRSS